MAAMKFNEILDQWPKLLAILTFVTIFVTLVHDWGYFLVVGSKFQSLQTTYDYLANAIEWLPATAIFLAYNLFTMNFETIIKKNTKSMPELFNTIGKNSSLIFILILGAFSIAVLLSLSPPMRLYFMPLMAAGAVYVLASFFIRNKSDGVALLTFVVSEAFLVTSLIFAFGVLQGQAALINFSDVYKITYKDQLSQNVGLLRTFEKGLLVRDYSSSAVVFLRWETIEKVSRIAPGNSSECGYWKLFCYWQDSSSQL